MFTLGGKTFHRVGSLLPDPSTPHAFAQIFMLDTEEASNRRICAMGRGAAHDALRPAVLSQLHDWFMQHNPWVQQFVAAARSDLPRLVWRSSDDIATMQMGALVAQSGSRRDIVIERQVLALACSICSNAFHMFLAGPFTAIHSRRPCVVPSSRVSFIVPFRYSRMA